MDQDFHKFLQFVIIVFIAISIIGCQHIFAWLISRPEKKFKIAGNLLVPFSVIVTVIIIYELIHSFK